MSISENQRRRGRSAGAGVRPAREPVTAETLLTGTAGGAGGTDALAGLRRAAVELDPRTFAGHFAADAWVRIPRPEGDVVLQGPDEIERAGREMRELLTSLSWTPSQRFVAAGQVVEVAVARATTGVDGEIRLPMRVVAALDPVGGIGSLTLWVDWAALYDPLGVESAHGAASALVAQARARDARGLRVFEVGPETAAIPRQPAPVPPQQSRSTSTRPPAAVIWWQQHRATLAGSLMAVAAAGVIAWVSLSVLKPIADARLGDARADPSATSPVLGADGGTGPDTGGTGPDAGATGGAGDPRGGSATPAGGAGTQIEGATPGAGAATPGPGAATGRPKVSDVPVIVQPPRTRPTVQRGEKVIFRSSVLFRTNSTELSNQGLTRLRALAERVRTENIRGTIQVNGYTDAQGSDEDNAALSLARASAVVAELGPALDGLPVRLAPQGFGESSPVAGNDTAEGMARNRRVVVVLPEVTTTR